MFEPEWWLQFSACPNTIDLRDFVQFKSQHLKASTSIPLETLIERGSELPLKGTTINLVGTNEQDISEASEILESKGYTVNQTIIWTECFVRATERHQPDLLIAGEEYNFLWSPSPVLEEYVNEIEKLLLESKCISNLDEAVSLDLACGAGRDVVFIAKRGWGKSIGIDYLPEQVEKSLLLAQRNGCEQKVVLLNRDLEKKGLPVEEFKEQCHLVTVARYLHRPHFHIIPDLIKPGGFLVFHTFMKGCETSSVGRPRRPQFLLNPGELRETFGPENGFTILADKVCPISDGRPTSFFVAQKNLV